jgi:hypothetical protein
MKNIHIVRAVISADVVFVIALLRGIVPSWQVLAVLVAANLIMAYMYGTNIAMIYKKAGVALDPEGEVIISGGIQ